MFVTLKTNYNYVRDFGPVTIANLAKGACNVDMAHIQYQGETLLLPPPRFPQVLAIGLVLDKFHIYRNGE